MNGHRVEMYNVNPLHLRCTGPVGIHCYCSYLHSMLYIGHLHLHCRDTNSFTFIATEIFHRISSLTKRSIIRGIVKVIKFVVLIRLIDG